MLRIKPSDIEVGDLHFRSELHLLRRFWHIVTGVLGLLVYFKSGLEVQMIANILFVLSGLGFMVEISRMMSSHINHFVIKVMGPLMRESEKQAFSGLPFYALGTALALVVFQEKIAILAILFLVFSDPISSIFGVMYGRDKLLPNKSLQGATAGFVTCYILCLFYGLAYLEPSFDLLTFALFGGAVGMASELISWKLDDNLTIPVISGCGLTVLNLFIPLF